MVLVPTEWEKVLEMELHRRNFGSGFSDNTFRHDSFFPFSQLQTKEELLWQLRSFRPTIATFFGATV
jgi:hypothetical protein